MLAQTLARRVQRHNAWSINYQLRLKQERTSASCFLAWQQSRKQIRTVRSSSRVPSSGSKLKAAAAAANPSPIPIPPQPSSQQSPATSTGTTSPAVSSSSSGSAQHRTARPPPLVAQGRSAPQRLPEIKYIDSLTKPQASRQAQDVEAKLLLGDHKEVLLYAAPSHGSLLAWSLIGGSAFATVAVNTASGLLMINGFSMWLKGPTIAGCMMGLVIGFNMLISTTRQINTIHLIRRDDNQIMLRVDTKWRIFFWEPKRIEVPFSEIATDRDVRDITFNMYTVNLKHRFKWTEAQKQQKPSYNPLVWLRALPSAIANSWSTVKRDTGRMFIRQGMMVVRIQGRNWKMDMWDARLLDNGLPLSKLIKEDLEIKNSVLGIIRRQLSNS